MPAVVQSGKRSAVEAQLIELQQQTLIAVNKLVDIQQQLLDVKRAELELKRQAVVMKKAEMMTRVLFQDKEGNWVTIGANSNEE